MGDNRARRLLHTVERAAYLAVAAPAVGRLRPPRLPHGVLARRLAFPVPGRKAHRDGSQPAAGARRRAQPGSGAAGDPGVVPARLLWAVNLMRLRRGTQPFRRLIEIRGREHLAVALAKGKGAILCSAHFGAYDSGFSVLHASGFPVTSIGRRWYSYDAGLSSAERRLWELYLRPVRRYRQRPTIEPWPRQPPGRGAGSCRAPRQ